MGLWRSWERACMACRRSRVQIPSGPPYYNPPSSLKSILPATKGTNHPITLRSIILATKGPIFFELISELKTDKNVCSTGRKNGSSIKDFEDDSGCDFGDDISLVIQSDCWNPESISFFNISKKNNIDS